MCIILKQMPDGISLQMQDLFFPNSLSFFSALVELFFRDLSDQNKTSSTLSQSESHWLAIMPQTALFLLLSQTLRDVGYLPPTALTARSQSHQTK